jgi:flagellar basal body L-ring protein FlgH
MFAGLLLALAPAAGVPLVSPVMPASPEFPHIREPNIQGPTPYENHSLSQPHPNSDNRMFPDIALKALKVDGDTLYVQLTNKGRSATQSTTLVAARAVANGMKSDLAQARTGRLAAGESRWVPVKGFSVRTASTSGAVFALSNATLVSAAARILPSAAGTLDRSGQGCGSCTAEADESNNELTRSGAAIEHGRPQ